MKGSFEHNISFENLDNRTKGASMLDEDEHPIRIRLPYLLNILNDSEISQFYYRFILFYEDVHGNEFEEEFPVHTVLLELPDEAREDANNEIEIDLEYILASPLSMIETPTGTRPLKFQEIQPESDNIFKAKIQQTYKGIFA